MSFAIGLDVGGSNLRAGAFRGDDAAPFLAHRELVGGERGPGELVERIAAIVARLAGAAGDADPGPIPVGVGIAAMLRDRDGTVSRSPHLGWSDVPFGAMLRARLGARFAASVYNDATAITWGEAVAGAARGCRDALVVYVGTGIGGGVIVDGRLLEGASGCAGEIGHVKVRWDDAAAPCNCGGRGCVEAYVGGSYVQARIRAALRAGQRSSAIELAGGDVDAVHPGHVDQAAAAGDPWARALWGELAPLLAVALGNAITLLNPDRVVLGGGMLGRTPTLRDQALAALAIITPPPLLAPVRIVMAALGDDAGMVGAALLADARVSIVGAA
jgi:glucokinase